MDEIVVIRVLDDDEELPPGVEVEPDFAEMATEDAVRHLMDFWGLGEADARFYLAIARGEIEGDVIAVDEDGSESAQASRDRASA